MNKFASPVSDKNVAPGTVPAEQAGAAQPVPGPNAAWNQVSGAPMSQPWVPVLAPVAQLSSQMARSSYGIFYMVIDKDGRSLGRWLIWGIGLVCVVLLTWIGIEGDEWFYASASITGGIVCLLSGTVEGGRSPWLVSIVSTPDGTVLVRPDSTVMCLRVLTALLVSTAGVCFFYVSLFSVDADIGSIAGGGVLSAAVAALYLVARIIGSQSCGCTVVSRQRMDMRGKGGIYYPIPQSDRPRVIGQHSSGRNLLIGAGQNIECLVVFTTLRIHPSRVRSLLTHYQTTPGALDRLLTPKACDEAVKILS